MATEIPLGSKETPAECRRTGPLLIAQWKKQGGGDVKVQVEAVKRNTHVHSEKQGEGRALKREGHRSYLSIQLQAKQRSSRIAP